MYYLLPFKFKDVDTARAAGAAVSIGADADAAVSSNGPGISEATGIGDNHYATASRASTGPIIPAAICTIHTYNAAGLDVGFSCEQAQEPTAGAFTVAAT